MTQFKVYFSNYGYEDVARYTAKDAEAARNEFYEEFPSSCVVDGIVELTGENNV